MSGPNGRMYTMNFEDVVVAAAQDFFALDFAGTGVMILHACYLGQSTLVGDANEEMHKVVIKTGATVDGSGGNPGVEVPSSLGSPAASAVGRINDDTIAGTGTIVEKHMDIYNIRVGWQYVPPPEQRITWSAERLVVGLLSTPTSVTMSGSIVWEELN